MAVLIIGAMMIASRTDAVVLTGVSWIVRGEGQRAEF